MTVATISTTWACPPLKSITFQAKPMVRVAIEPLSHRHLPLLEEGLKALYQYDPVVEVSLCIYNVMYVMYTYISKFYFHIPNIII